MKLTPNQKKALDIENHICVTAGAGSGKTTVLVDRYLNILKLREDVNPDQIVAITFTEKAAAEMKSRIIEEMDKPKYADIRDRHLEKIHAAPISTFHAFCSRILKENPFQAGVPANFGVLEGIEKKLLLKQTIKDTLKEIATDTEDRHRKELERCLQSFTESQKLVDMLISLMDKRDVMKHLLDTVYSDSSIDRLPTEWEKAFQDVLPSSVEIMEFIDCLQRIQSIARGKNADRVDFLTSDFASFQEFDSQELYKNRPDVFSYLSEIAKLITTAGNEIATRDFIGVRNDTTGYDYEIDFLVSIARKIKEAPTVDCNDVDSDDILLLSITRDLLTLYQRVLHEYGTAKLSQSKLDFADLQIYTRDLLKNNNRIREKLLNQYKFYMVDEFQDTNELQYELVMLLTDELKRGNLFVVGDPKQSIYGFRDADVRVFERTKEKIVSMGGKDIRLKENFRSLQNSVGFVNYLFGRLMGDERENDFEVIYEPINVGRTDKMDGVVEFILGQKNSEHANEFTLLAQHIKNIVNVRGEDSLNQQDIKDKGDSINYGDIAILIRARRHLPDIENALHLAGIPYLTSEGIGFYQRQEIYDIWNYLNFLNAPGKNDLSLIGVLRGPAFGISDNELFEISLQKGDSFWLKTQKYVSQEDRLKKAVRILKEQLKVAHRLPINQLILTVVNETGLIGTLRTGRKGEQRWANYQKLLDIARNFEAQENKPNLTNFIEYLDILITDEPREGDAPIEEDSDSVKIMTIHAAKGKEYPIVILPCLNRRGHFAKEPFIEEKLGIGFSPLIPSQEYDQSSPEIVQLMKDTAKAKDEAEKKRLLYVATTRAENRLILSGTLKENGNAENTLKILLEHLDINEGDELIEISDKLNFYPDVMDTPSDFHLKIPIIRQLEVTADDDHVSVDEKSVVRFPKKPIESLKPSEFESSYTVGELADFARCQLRYQLGNVLRVPPLEEGIIAEDSSDLNIAIRRTLSQIEQRLDSAEIEDRINNVLEDNPDIMNKMTESAARSTLRRHIENYLNSDISATMLSAKNPSCNKQIHAKTNGHIISGRMDRIFQDQSGNWHIAIFKTTDLHDTESCIPEMQLLAFLFFSSNPSENSVTITFLFTEKDELAQLHFNRTELDDITDFWHKQIRLLQKGENRKNLKHCYICPYADFQDQCIVNDPSGESSDNTKVF